MRSAAIYIFSLGLLILSAGCSHDKDSSRIEELNLMPVLWESDILVADPDMPQLKTLIPLYDRLDPSLLEFLSDTAEKTEDYIPESARAYAVESYDNKPREITISIGDRVDVLSYGEIKGGKTLYLVRTKDNTYAWLYPYHLEDEDGNRISGL